jgi:hypothetical protein
MSQAKICITDLIQQDGVSPSLIKRLESADKDKDGTLSVQEIVLLVRMEQRALADRKLFRNFLIALVIGMLILIAALCGTVYAIVKLSQEVGDDNGVLVSKSSGDVMSTGRVVQRVPNLAGALLNDDPFLAKMMAMGMKRVILPGKDGSSSFTVSQVSSITVETGKSALIRMADGNQLEVGGVSSSLNSTGGLRRSLKNNQDSQAEGEIAYRCIVIMPYQAQSAGCHPYYWVGLQLKYCYRILPDDTVEGYCTRR